MCNRRIKVLVLLVLSLETAYSQEKCRGLLDSCMLSMGLVDVQSLDKRISVDLRYSTTNNFLGKILYSDLKLAYLHPNLARSVVKAQDVLGRKRKGFRIVILDAARPMSVQETMYNAVKDTPFRDYVAPAENGGRHNYAVAVDLSILDENGDELDMGTRFDTFSNISHVGKEDQLLAEGKISRSAYNNRKLLYEVMDSAGLRAYRREWWHWQERMTMKEVRRKYKRLNF